MIHYPIFGICGLEEQRNDLTKKDKTEIFRFLSRLNKKRHIKPYTVLVTIHEEHLLVNFWYVSGREIRASYVIIDRSNGCIS